MVMMMMMMVMIDNGGGCGDYDNSDGDDDHDDNSDDDEPLYYCSGDDHDDNGYDVDDNADDSDDFNYYCDNEEDSSLKWWLSGLVIMMMIKMEMVNDDNDNGYEWLHWWCDVIYEIPLQENWVDLFTKFMHTILTKVVPDNLKACLRFVRLSNN